MKDQLVTNVDEEIPLTSNDESRFRKRPHEGSRLKCAACILCGYNETNVSYHRFPNDRTRNLWLRLCELPEGTKTKNLRLCGRHFREDQKWYTVDGRTHLKYGAIPELNLEIYGLSGAENERTDSDASNLQDESMQNISRLPSLTSIDMDDFENHSNSSAVELIEVVEMKIYRFNPTTPTEISQFPNESSQSEVSTTANQPEDEYENQSSKESQARGLEMHSYSKPASTEIALTNNEEVQSAKRLKPLRYFGDLTEDDFATPANARRSWSIAKRDIDKKTEKILRFQEENEKLERRLKNLKEVLRQLRMTGSIPAKFRKRRSDHDNASSSFASESLTDEE